MVDLIGLLDEHGVLSLFERRGDSFVGLETDSKVIMRNRNAIIFVPPSDVSVQSVSINARTERDARRAAPFAIEDDLAQSPDSIHVALGLVSGDGQRLVCAVRDDIMATWLAAMAERGLGDAAIYAPQSLLSENDTIVQGPQGTLGKVEGRSFSLDNDAEEAWLAGLLQSSDDLERHYFGDNTEAYVSQLVTWHADGRGIDLRQGGYAVRTPLDLTRLKRWRLAGGLAAAFGITWIGAQIWSAQNMQALAGDLERRSVEVVDRKSVV